MLLRYFLTVAITFSSSQDFSFTERLHFVKKIEILDIVKNSKPGETKREIAKLLGVGRTTLQKWLKEERELRTEWETVRQDRHKRAAITEKASNEEGQ